MGRNNLPVKCGSKALDVSLSSFVLPLFVGVIQLHICTPKRWKVNEPAEGGRGSMAHSMQCQCADKGGTVGAYSDKESAGADELSTLMPCSAHFLQRGGLRSEIRGHSAGEEDLLGPERTPTVLSENSDLELEDKSQEVTSLAASD